MNDEPDIVKQLKEEEKQGKLLFSEQSSSEEIELQDKMPEGALDDSVNSIKDLQKTDALDKDAPGFIDEHKQIAAALQEMKERYQALFNSTFELVYLYDFKGRFIDANPAAFKLFGYGKEELNSINFSTLLDKGQLLKAIKTNREIRKYGHQKEPMEYRVKTKNGATVDIETTAEILYHNGKPYAIQGIGHDITDRKKIEKALKESEEKLGKLFENSQNGIVICKLIKDEKGRPIDYIHISANPAVERHLGCKPETLINKTATDLIGKDAGKKYAEMNGSSVITGKPYSWVDYTPFYNKYLKMDSYSIKEDFFAITFVDITKEKNAEKEIRNLARLPAENPYPVLRISKDGKILYANDASVGLLAKWKSNVGDVAPERWRHFIENSLKSGKIKAEEEEEEEDASGKVFSFVIAPIIEAGYANVYGHDITERKKAEQELQASQEKYKKLFDSSPNLIIETDDAGNILSANEPLARSLGAPLEKLIGKNILSILPKEIAEQRSSIARKALHEGKNQETEDARGERYFHNIYVPITYSDGKKTVQVIGRDITDQKKAEENIKTSEERFRHISENVGEWIWEIDVKGLFTYTSPAVEKILGYKSEEIVTKKYWYDFFTPDIKEQLMKVGIEKLTTKEPAKNVLYAHVHKNGKIVLLETCTFPFLDKDGNLLGYRGVNTDVTERKKMEDLLNKSRDYFMNIIDAAGDPLFVKDGQCRFVTVNDALCKILKKSREELLGKTGAEFLLESEMEHFLEMDNKVLSSGEENLCEEKLTTGGGDVREIVTRKTRYVNPSGEKFVVGVIRDITERKQAEEAILQSEKKYRELADSLPQIVYETNEHGNITYTNKASFISLGYTQEDFKKGLNIFQMIAPCEREKLQSVIQKIQNGESTTGEVYLVQRKDGMTFPAIFHSVPIFKENKFVGFRGFAVDISERKKMEDSLKESEEKYRSLVENASDQIVMIDDEFKMISVNRAALELFGKTQNEIIGRTISELFPKEIAAKNIENVKKVFKTGQVFSFEEKQFVGENEFWASSILSPVKNDAGKTITVLGVIRDITERKKMEKELNESEEKYRNVVERAHDAIVILQDKNIIKYVNPRAFNILGYNPAEIIGTPMSDYVHPDEIPKVVEYYKRRLAGEDVPGVYDSVLVHKDGRKINVELSGDVITYHGKSADMIMVHDITEHKKAEEALKEKINELERFKKVTVDRELKMVELKNKIMQLQEESKRT